MVSGSLPGPGDIVLGKYRIVGELGRGGMGVVFDAVNVTTDGRVALKLLRAGTDRNAELHVRMDREGRAAARLRSRFVARVLDLDRTKDGSPVLVMERLDGHDLGVEMRRRGTLPVEEAVSYIVQACAGVAEAHALGIVHRDIKPGNLFLDTSNAANPIVRVLDFGLAKILEAGSVDLTSPSDLLGTPSYMAPEQLISPKDVDARSDVWALGVVLFRMLTAKLPFDGRGMEIAAHLVDSDPVPPIDREDVPRELVAVVAQALEKSRAKRFADARALGEALVPFIARPSPMTKLAIDDVGLPPTPRSSRASIGDVGATLPVPTPPPKRLSRGTADDVRPMLPLPTPPPKRPSPAGDDVDDTLPRGTPAPETGDDAEGTADTLDGRGKPVRRRRRSPDAKTRKMAVSAPSAPPSPFVSTNLYVVRSPRRWDFVTAQALVAALPRETRLLAAAVGALVLVLLIIGMSASSHSKVERQSVDSGLASLPPGPPELAPVSPLAPEEAPRGAVPAIAPAPRGTVGGASPSKHPPKSASNDVTPAKSLDLARAAALRNDPANVRRFLEPAVRAGRGTPEEANLVKQACKQMGDRPCVDDISMKYP